MLLTGACDGAAQWSRAAWEETLRSSQSALVSKPARAVMVTRAEQGIVAFGVLHAVDGEGEIENLGVHPSCRRQGFARQISVALLSWARFQGLQRLYLEVRASNIAAQALYRSIGFELTGERPGYYREPDDDAVLMTLAFDAPIGRGNDVSGPGTL